MDDHHYINQPHMDETNENWVIECIPPPRQNFLTPACRILSPLENHALLQAMTMCYQCQCQASSVPDVVSIPGHHLEGMCGRSPLE